MENVIESIRAAVATDATHEARVAGITACRTILATLEGRAGEPMVSAAPMNPSAIASVIGTLRGVPADQLLDLAIAKLRSALPAGAEVARVEPLKFHLVPAPVLGGSR
ncbi:MAG TPA: hypothetical protein VH143_19755 [Kofleriaceae bacterium]|jgi:hypothetical protein|nr:hypothetical protein [Kofleriaceae bacterium]